MPVEDPDVGVMATTAAFGFAAGGLMAISKPMSRREVFFNLLGGTILAASVPQVVEHYFGVHPIARALLGVCCGLSVPLLVGMIQSVTERFAKNKQDQIGGGS